MANKTKMSGISRKRVNRSNKRDTNSGVIGTPMAWPGSSAIAPGRAYVRLVTEVFSTPDFRALSKDGFTTWSSQLSGVLAPYKFWRVARCDAEVIVTGGAASVYSVAFNVSNAPTIDTSPPAVLNDDYAGVATALLRPKLAPPKGYWDQRPINWYTYSGAGDAAYSPPVSVAGGISLVGTGGASDGVVIGYLVCDIVVEFHTLL